MSGKNELRSSPISIDSGVVLAYLLGEESGNLVRTSIFSNDESAGKRASYISGPSLAELHCILCRIRGTGYAAETIETIMGAGYVTRVSSASLDIEAGRYKCARSIALADCYVLGAAKILRAKAVFARREEDLVGEIEKRSFDVEIVFLEDLTS